MNVALLRKIQAHIMEEPKRFVMHSLLFHDGGNDGCGTYDDDAGNTVEFPKCGTVACIGGWACLLGGVSGKDLNNIERKAQELLGLSDEQRNHLFYDDEWPGEFQDRYTNASTPLEHAQVARDRIEHLIITGE